MEISRGGGFGRTIGVVAHPIVEAAVSTLKMRRFVKAGSRSVVVVTVDRDGELTSKPLPSSPGSVRRRSMMRTFR